MSQIPIDVAPRLASPAADGLARARRSGPSFPIQALSANFNHVAGLACVVSTAGFAVVMLLGVFYRYALNKSLSWSDELALLLFTWAAFLSITTAYHGDRHIRVDLLDRHLGETNRLRLASAAQLLSGAYLLCLLLSSLEALPIASRGHSAALQLPQWVPYLAMPVCIALMVVHWISRIFTEGKTPAGWVTVTIAAGIAWLMHLPIGAHTSLGSGTLWGVYLAVALLPILIGVPVAFCLGLVGMTYVSASGSIPFDTAATQMFFGTQNLTLMAIPMLILAGGVMHAAGIAERIVDFAQVLVGRMRGGLGAADVVGSFLFGDISGSSVSDTAAVGSIMIPQMKKRGYQPAFSAALQAAAGTLGMLAPVSITVLLYATAINVSVGHLAAAMILPAIVTAASFVVWVYVHARRHGYPVEKVPRSQLRPRLMRALPGLLSGVLVVGGLLGGVFTPAEVGAVLLAYVTLLSLATGTVKPRSLYRITLDAAHTSGMTLLLVAASAFLGFVLAHGLASDFLLEAVNQVGTSKYVAILTVMLVFIVLGMVLEAPAIIFGFLPSFVPLLTQSGFDLVHFGVIFAINMGIGMLVPPVALNLFISTQLAGVRYGQAVRAVVPFIVIMGIDLALVIALPQIALWLPGMVFSR